MRDARLFTDRRDAGHQLADRLAGYARLDPVVLAMPRGGVPVAAEIATRLAAPLDILVVRKIGCPWQPELGLGALAEGGVRVLNEALIADVGVGRGALDEVTAQEQHELDRRVTRYRRDRRAVPVDGRAVILVDDGLATGYTALAAIEAIRRRGGRRVILAVPVAPRDSLERMRAAADEVVVVETPRWFPGVGAFYRRFDQTSDDEVVAILEGAARPGDVPRRALSDG